MAVVDLAGQRRCRASWHRAVRGLVAMTEFVILRGVYIATSARGHSPGTRTSRRATCRAGLAPPGLTLRA
jgi:hypothetical protein